MADFQTPRITQPNPSGPLFETLGGYVYADDTGVANAYVITVSPSPVLVVGTVVAFKASHANTGASTLQIIGATPGTPIPIKKSVSTDLSSGDITLNQIITVTYDGTNFQQTSGSGGGGGSSAFDAITSGTNTTAAMVVGSGATLEPTGTGVIEATELKTNTATPVAVGGSAPTHEGQILISQPGNASAVWSDPLVQGVYDPLTNADTGGISGGPIKPVLVGGRGSDGKLYDLATDTSGHLSVIGTVSVSGAVTSAVASYTRPSYVQDSNVPLSVDLSGFLRVRNAAQNSLADLVAGKRYNQIEINFSLGFDSAVISNSASGGGLFSVTNGTAVYSTTSSGTARSTGISVHSLDYRPGHEWYAYFTAAFTTPTDTVNSTYQRIGPYSTTDGFYLGYELIGGVNKFCLTQRQGSIDTHTDRSAWDGDPCTGLAGSEFTRSGVPVALDFTKINIFRLRGAWFGAAPVLLETFSPDGIWVRLHTFRFPNTLTAPYAYTTNWNMQVDVMKITSNGTDLVVVTPCWAIGTCDDEFELSTTIHDHTLAPTTRAVIAGKTPSGTYANVGLTPDSALTVGGSGVNSVGAYIFDPTHTATLAVVSDIFAYNTVSVEIVGSGATISAGELTFEGSINNSQWVGIVGFNVGANTQMSTAAYTVVLGTAVLLFNITGFNYFRIRNTVVIAGTGTPEATISFALQGLASPSLNLTTGSITVASNQGTPNSIGNAWPVYVTDDASHALTVNSTTPSGKYALDQNIVSILGTAPTAAGKLDVITQADTAIGGIVAPSKGLLILGKTADGSPAYDAIPLAAGGGSVVVSGSVTAAATLASETTKVIGTVRIADGAGGLLTSNSTATAGKFALDQNIISILGTAPTTVGKLDVKGADGDVFVRQTTSSNLHTEATQGASGTPTTPWYVRPGDPTTSIYVQTPITFSASGDNIVVAAVAAQTIRVYAIFFVNSDASLATNITIKDSTPTNFSGAFKLAAGGTVGGDGAGDPLFTTASGKAFELNSSAAVQISGTIWYTQS